MLLLLTIATTVKGAVGDCQVDGKLLGLAEENQLLAFGEIHGTKEIPKYFSDVVCAFAKHGQKVKVGLELAVAQSAIIDNYLASKGQLSDIKDLVLSPHWRTEFLDGRTSAAMFHLLERLRRLGKQGKAIEVFLFDTQDRANNERDNNMAKQITAQVTRDRDSVYLLLSGNIHSRTTKGVPWEPNFRPMSYQIKAQGYAIASILLTHQGGSAWLCMLKCETQSLKGHFTDDEAYTLLRNHSDFSGHDYRINLGKISASSPAYMSLTGGFSTKGQEN